MGDKSKIEWTDATWNPIHGCSQISAGCTHCYAETVSHRFGFTSKPWNTAHATENVQLHPERLEQPLHWKRPRRIFVNSMSDLFHEQVPDDFIDQVFGVMLACLVLVNKTAHTFQILTKRPERMRQYLSADPAELLKRWAKQMDGWIILDNPDVLFTELVYSQTCRDWDESGRNSSGSEYKPWGYAHRLFPLPNVWLGVSVENQQAADERIPLLLQTPTAVRFVSCEPLLGPVDLTPWVHTNGGCEGCDSSCDCPADKSVFADTDFNEETGTHPARVVDWVIVGGESGLNARPMSPWWARDLRDQCVEAGVSFFFKQWGEFAPVHELRCTEPGIKGKQWVNFDPDTSVCRVGRKNAGRVLDGRVWDEYPQIGGNVVSREVTQ